MNREDAFAHSRRHLRLRNRQNAVRTTSTAARGGGSRQCKYENEQHTRLHYHGIPFNGAPASEIVTGVSVTTTVTVTD